jgi:hypothetical protein
MIIWSSKGGKKKKGEYEPGDGDEVWEVLF